MDIKCLKNKIIKCKKCPRLVSYISEIKKKYPSYWCKPVPSFGSYSAEVLILGLAPGRFGSNKTGRMFTGDSSGNFMYPILYEAGFCNQPSSIHVDDGLKLNNCFITAMGKCAPPQNKPTKEELENCFPYFIEEMKLLKNLKVVIALGKIAFDGYLKWAKSFVGNGCVRNGCVRNGRVRNGRDHSLLRNIKFSHGAIYEKELPHILIASYHPSRQNTQTGRLTREMFENVFVEAKRYCK